MHSSLHIPAGIVALVLLAVAVVQTQAVAPGNPAFQRTWERTDQPVASSGVARTWIWGPEATTGVVSEPYAEAPSGMRQVQYYDKSRMEINDPSADPNSPFFVTNGLLVVELMTGRLQLGHDMFAQHDAANVNVAGDADDAQGITYAVLAGRRDDPPVADGIGIVQHINHNGLVADDPSLATYGVTAAQRVQVPGIDHQIARPFWEFMNSSGPVLEGGQIVNATLFVNPFYATGYPITEAYWADVKVAGTVRVVLLQCFERRCLTYTPGNPDGFLTEAGNVGQHYHTWRYEQIPDDGTPTATNTSTATTTGTPPTATSTSISTPTATEVSAPEYVFVTQWGKPHVPIVPLDNPTGVGVDSGNNVWVTDAGNNRLLQFDEHGIYLRGIGAHGTGPGQFDAPSDVAFGDDGRMYVVDSFNDRIQVFSAEGVYLSEWGARGVGDGQFHNPTGIAIHDNVVYVAEYTGYRVQMFDLEGGYQGQFGSIGDDPGQFSRLGLIAVAPDGTLYVADADNHRVQRFSGSGVYMGQFGSYGSGNGQFILPWGIAFDDGGDVYVTELNNHRVQKFNPDGGFLSTWGSYGTGFGQFVAPYGLRFDDEGKVYVADAQNHRVQKFTSDGTFVFDIFDNRRGTYTTPTGIAIDQNGNILTVDGHTDLPTISRYTPDGLSLDSYGRGRAGAGTYDVLHGVAVNAAGDVYVTDRVSNRIQRFSATWQYLGEWGTQGTAQGQFTGPTAIAIDAEGIVYVADSGNHRIQKFSSTGGFVGEWGSFGTGNGQFNDPQGIAIDGERVYVTDYNNNRVQVFDRDGEYITQFGTTPNGLEPLDRPLGIAVNLDGYVLVVEFGHSRVHIFTADGESVGTFGSAGSGTGQFNVPFAIACDDAGYVYVTDLNNDRVQKFAPVD